MAYLLLIFSALDFRRSAVQALIVVPTRELGMQVCALQITAIYVVTTIVWIKLLYFDLFISCCPFKVAKVARMLAAKPAGMEEMQRACTVMALLDGGMLKRQKSWLKVLFISIRDLIVPLYLFISSQGSACTKINLKDRI